MNVAKKKCSIESRAEGDRACEVYANLAPFEFSSSIIYRYDIEIEIEDFVQLDQKTKQPQRNKIKQQKRIISSSNFEIFERFYLDEKKKLKESIFTSEPVFDGRCIIYSRDKLRNLDSKGQAIRKVKLKVPEMKFQKTFVIRLTTPGDVNRIDLSVLNQPDARAVQKELQALDIIATYAAKKLNHLFINSNMFRRHDDLMTLSGEERSKIRFEIGELKEASFGSHQACKLTECGVQINVDRVATVFNQGGKLIDLIEKYLSNGQSRLRSESGENVGGFKRASSNSTSRNDPSSAFNKRPGSMYGNHSGNAPSRNDPSSAFNKRPGSMYGNHSGNAPSRNDPSSAFNKRPGSMYGNHSGNAPSRNDPSSAFNKRPGSMYGNHSGNEPSRNASPPHQFLNDRCKLFPNDVQALNFHLKGLSCVVDHLQYKPKHTIFGLSDKPIGFLKVDILERDSQISKKQTVKEYFELKYTDYIEKLGRPLFGNLPALNCGTDKRPTYFPIECVSIIFDQYSTRKLNDFQQACMTTKCASQLPSERFNECAMQLDTLLKSSSQLTKIDYLRLFGIRFNDKFTRVQGHYFNAPAIFGSNGKVGESRLEKQVTIENGDWRDNGFARPANITPSRWIVINFNRAYRREFHGPLSKDQINSFVFGLTNAAQSNYLKLGQPIEIDHNAAFDGAPSVDTLVCNYLKKHSDIHLIVFIFPRDDEIYSCIKHLSELSFGLVTQCVKKENVCKKLSDSSFFGNLILKINSKLGGTNFQLLPQSKRGKDYPRPLRKVTMIVGLDVSHPSKDDRIDSSIAAAVASYDNEYVNYFSKAIIQPKANVEIIDIKNLMREMLDNFVSKNKRSPDYVLVYRDGVSEGQYQEVIAKEVNVIKEVCKAYSTGRTPEVTFIVAQKRHHTRFLPVRQEDRDGRNENVKCGLVVDRDVVSNFYHEFYLVAHRGLKGTSRPTRYTVLYDEADNRSEDLQKTTYYLSYLFPRCNKVVSLVPAIQYSHFQAFRVRFYLKHMGYNRNQKTGRPTELEDYEIRDLNKKITVKPQLQNRLYFI